MPTGKTMFNEFVVRLPPKNEKAVIKLSRKKL